MKKEEYLKIIQVKDEVLASYRELHKGVMIVKSEKSGKPVVRFILDDPKESEALPKSIDFGSSVLETDFVCHGLDLAAVWDKFLWANDTKKDGAANRQRVRPLRGGCSIVSQSSLDTKLGSFGTLGCFVVDNEDDTICGLTNNHVVVQDAFITKLSPDYAEPATNATSSNIVGQKIYQGREDYFDTPELSGSGYQDGDHIGIVKRYVPIGVFYAKQFDETKNVVTCGPNTYIEGQDKSNSLIDTNKKVSALVDAALIAMDYDQQIDGWKQVGIEDESFHAEYPEFITESEFWDIMYDTAWGNFATDETYEDDKGRPDIILSGRTTGGKMSGQKLVDDHTYNTDINIVAPLTDFHINYGSDAVSDGYLPVMMRNSFAIGLQPSGASDLDPSNPDSNKWITEPILPGDSGSAVFIKVADKWKILGLVYAASKIPSLEEISQLAAGGGQDIPMRIGICCPMYIIAEQLNIRAWDGSMSYRWSTAPNKNYNRANIDNPETVVIDGATTRSQVVYNGEIYYLAGTIPDSESKGQVVPITYDIAAKFKVVSIIPNKTVDPLVPGAGNACPVGYEYDAFHNQCLCEEKILYTRGVSRENPNLDSDTITVNSDDIIKIGTGKYLFELNNTNIVSNITKGYVFDTDIPESQIVAKTIDGGSTLVNQTDEIHGRDLEHYSQHNQSIKNSFAYDAGGNTLPKGIIKYSDQSFHLFPRQVNTEAEAIQRIAVEIKAPFSKFNIGIPSRDYKPLTFQYDELANQAEEDAHFTSIDTHSLLDVQPYCSALKYDPFNAVMLYPIYRFQDLLDKNLLHLAASRFLGFGHGNNSELNRVAGYQLDDSFRYNGQEVSFINSGSYYELWIRNGQISEFFEGLVIQGEIGGHTFQYTVPSSFSEDIIMSGLAAQIDKGTDLSAVYSGRSITIIYTNESNYNLIGYQGSGKFTELWKTQNTFPSINIKWLDARESTSGVSIGYIAHGPFSDDTTAFNTNSVFDFRVMKPGNSNVLVNQTRTKEAICHNSSTLIPINALINPNTRVASKYGLYNPRAVVLNEDGHSVSSVNETQWDGFLDENGGGVGSFEDWNQFDGAHAEPWSNHDVTSQRADPYATTSKFSQVVYAQYYILNPNWTEGWAAVRQKWNIPEDDTLNTPLWHNFFSMGWAGTKQDSLKIDASINLDILPATSYEGYYNNSNNEKLDDIKYSMVQNKG